YRANIVVLDPALMTRNDSVFAQYVKPIVENVDFTHFHLLAQTGSAVELCRLVDEISELERNKPPAYELTIIGLLHLAFSRIYLAYIDETVQMHPIDRDASTQRRMSQYIYDHFAEKISLDDIAAAGNVSRSKCSKVFKHFLQKSPIDFLNLYRLEVASRLLKSTDESVSRIAIACGFSQQSYFDRQFGRTYGCTPRQYREQYAQAN
ncbi:MAG: helix-turn-helix transcriptional regulator, partial [Eggerthellaceae bacterium]|nr:helix-turn-helix transcriptional regulator [Eggerthellaceae bacterium]